MAAVIAALRAGRNDDPDPVRHPGLACGRPYRHPQGLRQSGWSQEPTYVGSDDVDGPAAAIYSLIQAAKFNDIDPEVWPAEDLARLPDHPPGPPTAILEMEGRPQAG
ncbi:transposase domain-containing protein [Bradyrhizobium sp. SZCCHNPS2010]|uniref:transposase domain-containing protein n=1 Tax=Bradyrhizobium sp. SZCCHNPS2010 TaxID=3057333 RepID=UPI002915DA25|nr:transposase domain-containing protein [Bradyrhizobium sp. SZCCHNPS2010]